MSKNKDPIIKFTNVTKEFTLYSQKTFKEFLPALFGNKKTKESFTALKNISFSVNKGETLGIIGPNGAGKSTILKLIANVMSPTKGKVIVNGKVSPLIELGAGFHPELTGKENVYLNGSILGLSKKQIDQYYQDILNFSELHKFINQPIKHYSSGMYMRLAFSVAIHVNPQILLIDEILAVGDTAFQQKCFAKMEQFKKSGITIIFVSHSMQSIQSFCTKALYIKKGQLISQGNPHTICQKYLPI